MNKQMWGAKSPRQMAAFGEPAPLDTFGPQVWTQDKLREAMAACPAHVACPEARRTNDTGDAMKRREELAEFMADGDRRTSQDVADYLGTSLDYARKLLRECGYARLDRPKHSTVWWLE